MVNQILPLSHLKFWANWSTAITSWLDLYSDDVGLISYEFTLMERLGFFVYGRESYWMSVPKTITLAAVKRAALEVLSTAEDDGGIEPIRPERLLQTVSKMEAETSRARLIALRQFNANNMKFATLV